MYIYAEQYDIESDYVAEDYAEWLERDDQILEALYVYAPSLLTALIACLHTMIAVQVILYSVRSNKLEDDLEEDSPITAFNMSLRHKNPEINYYNDVKITC